MADITVDGRVKVWIFPACANINAPTLTEINAGVAVDGLLTPDGLIGFEPDTAAVDTSSLNSTFNTKGPGRADYSGTMFRLKKQAGSDAVYNAYPRDTAAFVAIRRDGTLATTAWASGQKLGVYPVVTGETRDLAPEVNSVQKWELPLFVSPAPQQRATIA